MSEAFVYCWTDFGTNKLYVGVHKGTPDDGYICSSKIMLEEHTKRPNDFSREIVAQGTFADCYSLETAILKTMKVDKDPGFYNMGLNCGPFHRVGAKHTPGQTKALSARSLGNKYGLGYKHTEEHRRSLIGNQHAKGSKRTIEDSAARSAWQTGKKRGPYGIQRKNT